MLRLLCHDIGVRTRAIVIATGLAVIIAAIAIVAATWPTLPARTLPKPVAITYLPMGGQAVEVPKTACLAPIIAELRKRPNWTLRIDDMRWTDYSGPDDDPHHATIFVDASGATWRSEWIRGRRCRSRKPSFAR